MRPQTVLKLSVFAVAVMIVILGWNSASAGVRRAVNIIRLANGLNDGLVSYWSFDGPSVSGTTATDDSGSGNTGTLTSGPTVAPGIVGQALAFDGVNDLVSATIFNSAAYTWCMWAKSPSAPKSTAVEQPIVNGSTVESWGFSWSHSNSTFIQAAFHRITGGAYVAAKLTSTLSRNAWYHLCGTWDGSNLSAYLNGISEATNGAASVLTASGTFRLGTDGTDHFPGTIDEARIYNRALSDAEINYLYNHTAREKIAKITSGNTSRAYLDVSQNNSLRRGLVGSWSFNGPDVSGITAIDSSNGGNNGTLTGGTATAPGIVGQGLSFDGVDDAVNVADNANMRTTSDWTRSMWVKSNIPSGGDGALHEVLTQRTTTSKFLMRMNSDGTWVLFYQSTGGGFNSINSSNYSPRNWQHLVATKSGATVTLYVNGVSANTAADAENFTDNSHEVFIGSQNGGTQYFNGVIDEVRIYDRALSAAEVGELYRAGRRE